MEEILFLSRKRILRTKKKKILDNSCKVTNISQADGSDISLSVLPSHLPQLTVTQQETEDTVEEGVEDMLEDQQEDRVEDSVEDRVPITFSWPSLEVEGHVNVHTKEETADPKHVKVGLKHNFHRISSACDSGYSETDICSTLTTGHENNAMNVVREIIDCKEEEDGCDNSYLDELRLYFNLDKMLDRTSHEENCFKELDLSFSSEGSSHCSCSDLSLAKTAGSLSPLTNRQTVISIAQKFSANTVTSLTSLQHSPVSRPPHLPITRGDSSQSLPVSSSPSQTSDCLLSGLRRLSLPKVNQVTAEVILVEQTAQSREIFI